MGSTVNNGRTLYKFLMRTVKKLPQSAQGHYKHSIRQSFNSHMDESDPERLEQIYARAVKDAQWLLNKYKVKAELTSEHSILKKGGQS